MRYKTCPRVRGGSMFRWTDSDWLTARVDRWINHNQGYTKLKSRWLSKGCQTMLDRPSRAFWSRSDSEILNSIPDQAGEHTDMSRLSLEENSRNGNEDRSTEMNFVEKSLQYDQDIADYIAYLNKPVINMNDHFIEIHQYHYDPTNFLAPRTEELPPIRPPTRRRKHKVDLRKTEIVDNKGICSLKDPQYSEFLVKKSPSSSRNIKIVSGRSSDEENKKPGDELDEHRGLEQATSPLEQATSPLDNRADTVVNRTNHVRVKRGETFSANPEQGPDVPRNFLSFRTSKKNKSGRRKKKRVVVGEAGVDGPIWPAVLLTFDRSISPGPQESPDESEV